MAKSRFKLPVAVIALTGVVTFNINERTIYSTLSIPIMNDKKLELNSICLKQFQKRLQDMLYFIINKKSMVGRRMLKLINIRLKEVFSENNNKPFDGRSVIILNDFRQLPLILDLLIYINTEGNNSLKD